MSLGKRAGRDIPAQAASTSLFSETLAPVPDDPTSVTSLQLNCLIIKGDSEPFTITVSANRNIHYLKVLVHERGKNGVLSGVDAIDLVLLRVRIHDSHAKKAQTPTILTSHCSAQETDGVEARTDSWHAHSGVRHCVVRVC